MGRRPEEATPQAGCDDPPAARGCGGKSGERSTGLRGRRTVVEALDGIGFRTVEPNRAEQHPVDGVEPSGQRHSTCRCLRYWLLE